MAVQKIVATIVAKAENDAEVLSALRSLVDHTRLEEGCISYVLHRDIKNPLSYTMIEVWRDSDAIASHNASEHLMAFVISTKGKIDKLDVVTIEEIL